MRDFKHILSLGGGGTEKNLDIGGEGNPKKKEIFKFSPTHPPLINNERSLTITGHRQVSNCSSDISIFIEETSPTYAHAHHHRCR